MGYLPKQIGWSVESGLMQNLAKQIDKLSKVVGNNTTSTTTTIV